MVGMSRAAPDLIAGYLADLCAGLRVPANEAELILAEAEDHLRETAAAGLATGMTELEAQESAISSFGPVRAVAQAHRWRNITIGDVAMAAWKLGALLALIFGVGGLAGMQGYAYLMRAAPYGPGPVEPVVPGYAAAAAGGLILLAARRLARRGTPRRDSLPPGVSASCFLVASALLWVYETWVRSPWALPQPPLHLHCAYSCNWSAPAPGPLPSAGPALIVLAVYAAMAVGGLALLAACRLARRGRPIRCPLSPWVTASCFLLAAAPLLALIVKDGMLPVAPAIGASWNSPVSEGTVYAAPFVTRAVIAGCLAVAAGFGAQTALRRARRRLRSTAFRLVAAV